MPAVSFTIQLISGLAVGCIYGLVAIGFSMIFRATGLVNFAQGDIMMLGAFLGYSVLVANRFSVEAEGNPGSIDALKAAVAAVGPEKLQTLAN